MEKWIEGDKEREIKKGGGRQGDKVRERGRLK